MTSRPENTWPNVVKSGRVKRMMPVRDKSRRMRVTMARVRPTVRARRCTPTGSFPARIEMKTMLSMPRTISSTVRVRSAIQVSGEVSESMTKTTSSKDVTRGRNTKASRKTVVRFRVTPLCYGSARRLCSTSFGFEKLAAAYSPTTSQSQYHRR